MGSLYILAVLFGILQGLDACTQRAIDKCWSPTNNYLTSQGYDTDHPEFALFHLNTKELKTYCRLYKHNISSCLKDLVSSCTYDERKVFEGREDAMDFFCGDGFDDYVKHKDCIGSDDTQADIRECTQQFNDDFNDLLYTSDSNQELEDNFCEALYTSVDCDRDAVDDLCGEDAADWVEKYELALYEPYMEQFDCHRHHHISIIASVIIGIVAMLILVCTFTACFVFFKNKNRYRHQNTSQSVVYSNNHTASAHVSFPQSTAQNEKSGVPPDVPLPTPPYPGVYTQPMAPPAYYSNPQASTRDGSTVASEAPTSEEPPAYYSTIQD